MKFKVDGCTFDTEKAKVAVKVSMRDMDRCRYHDAMLCRTNKGTWIIYRDSDFGAITPGSGLHIRHAFDDDEIKKLLTSAGRMDLVQKYFEKPTKAQEEQ